MSTYYQPAMQQHIYKMPFIEIFQLFIEYVPLISQMASCMLMQQGEALVSQWPDEIKHHRDDALKKLAWRRSVTIHSSSHGTRCWTRSEHCWWNSMQLDYHRGIRQLFLNMVVIILYYKYFTRYWTILKQIRDITIMNVNDHLKYLFNNGKMHDFYGKCYQ